MFVSTIVSILVAYKYTLQLLDEVEDFKEDD